MGKWILGVYAALVVAGIVAVGLLHGDFAAWRAEIVLERENDPQRRIAQTALGPVEYAIHGEGQPVLVMSGTPGAYDAALAGPRVEPDRSLGGMTISVSRPGYRGTPLESGESFAAQADLMAALLDELGIERAVIFGAMSGSYPAFQFALRHPERTRGLILMAPNVAPLPASPQPGVRSGSADFFAWTVTRMGPPPGEADPADPVQRRIWEVAVRASVPAEGLLDGRRNDAIQGRDEAIAAWELERIAAPTLILQGAGDPRTAAGSSAALAARLPDAELAMFEQSGRYLTITQRHESDARIRAFLDGLDGRSLAAAPAS